VIAAGGLMLMAAINLRPRVVLSPIVAVADVKQPAIEV
jgi:hypothetical protein